jgi:hypothetical protein
VFPFFRALPQIANTSGMVNSFQFKAIVKEFRSDRVLELENSLITLGTILNS